VTKSDRVIIQRIKQFAKKYRLEKIEEKMEEKQTIADMFGIDKTTYGRYLANQKCVKKVITIDRIEIFIQYAKTKIKVPKESEFMEAFASMLFNEEWEERYGNTYENSINSVDSFERNHGPISFISESLTSPVFIFTNSNEILQEMLSVLFSNERKIDEICIVLNDDFSMETLSVLQKAKAVAQKENSNIEDLNWSCFRSKHTIFYNILAYKHSEECSGLFFSENECSNLSEIGRYLINDEMDKNKLRLVENSGSINFMDHINKHLANH
jgi:hypothetical protein